MNTVLKPNTNIILKYESWFECAETTFILVDTVLHNLHDRRIAYDTLDLYQKLLMVIYDKCSSSYRTVTTLCGCGQTLDAQTIVRKILEAVINLKFISQDPEKRSLEFVYHGPVSEYERLERQAKQRSVQNAFALPQHIVDQLKEIYYREKGLYPLDKKGRLDWRYRDRWSGISLESMADQCGLQYFNEAYRVFCSTTHTSSDDITVFFDIEKSSYRESNDIEVIPKLLLTFLASFIELLSMTITSFDLKLDGSLEQIRLRLLGLQTTM
jgi:hypothetical protein